jgi:hypothetical protein
VVIAGLAFALPVLLLIPCCLFVTQPAIVLACCAHPADVELNQCVDLEQKMLGREFLES